MTDHYYTPAPQSDHKPGEVTVTYRGRTFHFETDSGVFSRTELDRGTEVLLNALPDEMSGEVLDMGCGYGAIGVAVGAVNAACHVTMADINERACGLARINAERAGLRTQVLESDGYARVLNERYDWVLQNPPI
ncbi:MAG: methyltransferase, partial [Clostridia bacterium]